MQAAPIIGSRHSRLRTLNLTYARPYSRVHRLALQFRDAANNREVPRTQLHSTVQDAPAAAMVTHARGVNLT